MCPEYRANVYVDSKPEILNPENGAIIKAVRRNPEWNAVKDVKKGKRFDVIVVADTKKAAKKEVEKVVSDFLSNPVIEEFTIASFKKIKTKKIF